MAESDDSSDDGGGFFFSIRRPCQASAIEMPPDETSETNNGSQSKRLKLGDVHEPKHHLTALVQPSSAGDGCASEGRYIGLCGDEEHLVSSYKDHTDFIGVDDNIAAADTTFYGMSDNVRKVIFETFRISALHPWQDEMLVRHRADNKNGLVVAHTSGGKTLVAVILLIRSMIFDRKDTILALPYVAIVAEKVRELKALSAQLKTFSIKEYAGSKGVFPIPKQKSSLRTLYVATNEKASLIFKSLCKENRHCQELGLVVFDEFHMVSDGLRGMVIKELVVCLRFFSAASSTKIIGMSATIGNIPDLCIFLGGGIEGNCNLYQVTRRPTVISEHLVVAGAAIPIIRDESGVGKIQDQSRIDILPDDDILLAEANRHLFSTYDEKVIARLTFDSMKRNESVLIFCSSRNKCVKMCQSLTTASTLLYSEQRDESNLVQRQRSHVSGHLREESRGMVDPVLLHGISVGIAYHSAALNSTERKAIEEAFSRNIISVLCCTSTLAAGVNLPARRVIIPDPYIGINFLTCSRYLQMVGRAGRSNVLRLLSCPEQIRQHQSNEQSLDTADSYIFVQPNNVGKFHELVNSHVENVNSQLNLSSSYFKLMSSKRDPAGISSPKSKFTGVTRLVISGIDMAGGSMKLTELIEMYRLTLLYQMGEQKSIEKKGEKLPVPQLFLQEVQDLVLGGYLEAASVTPAQEMLPEGSLMQSLPVVLEQHQIGLILQNLKVHDTTQYNDILLRLTPFASAISAGSLSIEEAEVFMAEAEGFQEGICLRNPLTILFLSITQEMSKELVVESHANDGKSMTMLIDKLIVRDFSSHPDKEAMIQCGLSESQLNRWVVGCPRTREDVVFKSILTRLWSAMFVKEIWTNPGDLEALCQKFGFDRGSALELSQSLASRCNSLKSFCNSIDRFWWYPPIATYLSLRMRDACVDELRPLLAINHVTIERAKIMLQMGLKTVGDVASLYPPTILCDKIKFLSKWMALEIVLDARMQIAQEALELSAESKDRQESLKHAT